MTRAEFLANRKKGIGGSDIGVLLGLSKYKTPHQLWLDKTGRQSSDQESEAAYWGNALEPVIRQVYQERTGFKVETPGQLVHPEVDIAVANVDGIVPNDRVLEIKTVNTFYAQTDDWGADGSDELPPTYLAQVQWYMGVTGLPRADLAALVGGQQLRIYHIDAVPALFSQMLDRAQTWWDKYVVKDTPPPPGNAAEAAEVWPKSKEGASVTASAALEKKVRQLKKVRARIKTLKECEDAIKDVLVPAFAYAEEMQVSGHKIATFKSSKDRTSINWQAAYESLNPEPHHIAQFTTTKPGARTLRIYIKD